MMRKQRGDTIVEVLIAMTLLGLVLASSYSVANRAARIAQISRDRVEATQIIQQQAEALRWLRDNQGFENLKNSVEFSGNYTTPFYMTLNGSNEWEVTRGANSDDGSVSDPADCSVLIGVSSAASVDSCFGDKYYRYTIVPKERSIDTLGFEIVIVWERLGGGQDFSTINMSLTDA